MKTLIKTLVITFGLGFLVAISGCAPEVGSDKWCTQLKAKPKADWSSNELADFTKNCVFK